MKQVATTIFRFRIQVLILLALVTVFLGVHAGQLKLVTDFSKMVPQEHEFIQDYSPYKEYFGGGNQIRVSVSRKNKTIVDTEFLKKLRDINEDVYFVKGINRRSVRSMVSPETIVFFINEEGFNRGMVVPEIIPETEEGLSQIEKNIALGGLLGRLVSMDMKSALIAAEVYETGVDYLSVYRQLNEIRDKYSDDDISIGVNGFAMVAGFVNDALPKILGLFALSITITAFILYRCFRHLGLALLPLFSGFLSVLCSLGIARLIGINLDPMTTIVPFLVFSIGASHGIQMVKRYQEECSFHAEGYDAALHALAALMGPGIVALTTDAVGFLTITFVPIGVIRDLALTASIGVACIIVANILVLTLILSFLPNVLSSETKPAPEQIQPYLSRILTGISKLTYGRNAYRVTAVAFVLLLIGLFSSRTMTVGDVNPGEPLLWEDSVYNTDAAKMMMDYMFGIDCLSVVVTGDDPGVCKRYDVMQTMEAYESVIGNIPGVTVAVSSLLIGKMVNEMFHEGDLRWRVLPQTPRELGFIFDAAGSNDDTKFMTMHCQSMNIMVYLTDHKGDTIRRVIEASKEFIADHPMSGGDRFVLAGGNAGVMAATNEVVEKAQVPMLFLVYLTIFVLCLLVFQGLKAPLIILAPLFLVSVISTAFMKAVGLGLNVNTLPVASLGVGIGVDYGIYVYSRLREERRAQPHFPEAVNTTLHTAGAAVFFTGSAKSVGVLIWLLSDLKFQADMGLLTGFIFIANLIGAVVLMPALVYVFDVKDKTGNKTEDREEIVSH